MAANCFSITSMAHFAMCGGLASPSRRAASAITSVIYFGVLPQPSACLATASERVGRNPDCLESFL